MKSLPSRFIYTRFHSLKLGFLRNFSFFHLHTRIDMLITIDSYLLIVLRVHLAWAAWECLEWEE